MAQKMTGALVFDERTDRYDIRFDLNSYYGGLHCGELFRHSTYRYISYQILTIHGGFPNFLSILLFSVTQCIR